MKGNREVTKSLNVVETEETVNNIITTSLRIHSKLKKKQKNWVSISDKVVHHVSKITRRKRLIRKRKKNRKMIIRMQDRLLKKMTRTFVRLSIWRNRNHKRPKSNSTRMKTEEVMTNLVKEEATTRAPKSLKGVFIRKGTIKICRMNTKKILKDKDRPMTTRINIRKIPNSKIILTKFDRKEDAVAILVEVIENIDPKLSNTSPEKTLTKA